MNLQIRHPRARALASELAERNHVTMTEAVIQALEAEVKRARDAVPLRDRVQKLVDDLNAKSKPGGRDWTKEERDEMWGHV